MFEFVSAEDGYDILADSNGDEIYVQHGTLARLVNFHDIDLLHEYRKYVADRLRTGSQPGFEDHVRDMVIDPEYVDEMAWCTDCHDPEPNYDEMTNMGDHGAVCESCSESYTYCEYCEEYVHQDNTVWMESIGQSVCDNCRDSQFAYCEHCDDYYHHDDDGHYHDDDDCDCESPVQSFTVRNDGNDPLANDVPTTIALPAGEVSEQGIEAMRRLVYEHARQIAFDARRGLEDYSPEWYAASGPESDFVKWHELGYSITTLEAEWQTKEGNFTKRLSRMAYKTHGIKVPPEMLSEIGNIGNAHSQGVNFEVEVTRDLNQSAGAFGHEDSCYWQSYSSSRCTLKSNGAFGLRSFSGSRTDWNGGVSGRAWVMPLKVTDDGGLTPTFDAHDAAAFVVFNGYGALSGYAPARIMSHMAGMTYRKIEFYGGEMYVNAGGYLIAPEEIAQDYTDGSLSLSIDPHSSLARLERVAADAAA